jgi:hypothetical protein
MCLQKRGFVAASVRVDNSRNPLRCSCRLAFLGVGIIPSCKSNDEVRDVEHDAFEPMTLAILERKSVTIAMLEGDLPGLT